MIKHIVQHPVRLGAQSRPILRIEIGSEGGRMSEHTFGKVSRFALGRVAAA
jgi:hypothetical protein